MTVTPEQIITKAKELIETEGWIQGSYRALKKPNQPAPRVCGRCISGALADAANFYGVFDGSYETVTNINSPYYKAREMVKKKTDGTLPTWNDKSGRTKIEVLEALTV